MDAPTDRPKKLGDEDNLSRNLINSTEQQEPHFFSLSKSTFGFVDRVLPPC